MSTQHIVMPGTAGNYISTEDVNLLDADTAHLQQSQGEWSNSSLIVTHTATPTYTPSFGTAAGVATRLGSGASSPVPFRIPTGTSGIPWTAATESAFGMDLVTSVADKKFRVDVVWADAAGATVGQASGSYVSANVGVPIRVEVTGTSPALTAFIRFDVYMAPDGSNILVGDSVEFSAAALRLGSDATFIPSLGIVGDLDLRAKVALDDWTPAAASYILTNLSGFTGYQLYVNTSGELVSRYGDGSSTRSEGTTALGFTDGSAHVVTVEWDESAGTLEWFADGASIGTDSYSAGPGVPSTSDLEVGSGFDGDVYYVEVRDGIDGPIVARMDAADAAGAT